MTDNELVALAKAATPGPWRRIAENERTEEQPLLVSAEYVPPVKSWEHPTRGVICEFGNATQYYPTAGTSPSEPDAAYIAAVSPEVVLALIERVQRAETVQDGYRRMLARKLGYRIVKEWSTVADELTVEEFDTVMADALTRANATVPR